MNPVQQALMAHATALRNASLTAEDVAVDLLVKTAGVSEEEAQVMIAQDAMEKSAYATLAAKGVDHLDAMKMVKAANLNVKDLITFTPSVKLQNVTADVLEKAAEYIQTLESKLAFIEIQNEELFELQKQASIQTMELPESLDRLRQSGDFTTEDLLQLKSIEPELLNKIAGTPQDESWGMGNASGNKAAGGMDSFTAWLAS